MTASPPYVLVPREATEEMVIAGCRHENMGDMAGRYNAMLSARPESSSKLQQAQEEVIRCARERREHYIKHGNYNAEYGRLVEAEDHALASLSAAEGGKT